MGMYGCCHTPFCTCRGFFILSLIHILKTVLEELAHGTAYGTVLRSKGMIPSTEPGEWLYFDLVPEEYEIRTGAADYTGKVCVIGSNLNEEALSRAFGRK